MRALVAGWRLELWISRAYPDTLIPLFTAPLFMVIFLMIIRDAGRDDLTAYGVVAPALIALWSFALFEAGSIMQFERWQGTLELLVAAPAELLAVVFGRILTVATSGLLAFAEVWLVARLFDVEFRIHHPAVFVATLAATAAATAATALAMAALFVLLREAATFQNAASYPFYVLGGVLVPVSFLPSWIQPLSSVIFLSWSADLLRATVSADPVTDPGRRLAAILALGALGLAVGWALMRWVLLRVRAAGSLQLQ